MLTTEQIDEVWRRKLEAEVRGLYFGDLAGIYSRQKQWILGGSFFLSSGSVIALLGKAPSWVPIICSLLIAAATAYSIAINLERRIRTMAKLHYSWEELHHRYDFLWNHTYEDDAEEQLASLLKKELDLSELATTEAPNDQTRIAKWQNSVLQRYHLNNA